jgi:hypothetical protein
MHIKNLILDRLAESHATARDIATAHELKLHDVHNAIQRMIRMKQIAPVGVGPREGARGKFPYLYAKVR